MDKFSRVSFEQLVLGFNELMRREDRKELRHWNCDLSSGVLNPGFEMVHELLKLFYFRMRRICVVQIWLKVNFDQTWKKVFIKG